LTLQTFALSIIKPLNAPLIATHYLSNIVQAYVVAINTPTAALLITATGTDGHFGRGIQALDKARTIIEITLNSALSECYYLAVRSCIIGEVEWWQRQHAASKSEWRAQDENKTSRHNKAHDTFRQL
jgi:hypothetical protein